MTSSKRKVKEDILNKLNMFYIELIDISFDMKVKQISTEKLDNDIETIKNVIDNFENFGILDENILKNVNKLYRKYRKLIRTIWS